MRKNQEIVQRSTGLLNQVAVISRYKLEGRYCITKFESGFVHEYYNKQDKSLTLLHSNRRAGEADLSR